MRPKSTVVYSSSSGGGAEAAPAMAEEWQAIDDVCCSVITAWQARASESVSTALEN